MVSSIDGRTDAGAFANVTRKVDYQLFHEKLSGDAWLCGRTTMQQDFAEKKPFIPKSRKPAGRTPVFVSRRARSYAVCVDTVGKLRWRGDEVGGDHLICILSERVPQDYLSMLRQKQISYVVAGRSSVDLARAVRLLRAEFGIRRLLLEGGGHLNGSFAAADLIDEVSLLLAPAIDGRQGVTALFDGIKPAKRKAVSLKLTTVKRLPGGVLWLRYKLARSKSR
jgi:riboflavin biosynthesis pyrimidine reductase